MTKDFQAYFPTWEFLLQTIDFETHLEKYRDVVLAIGKSRIDLDQDDGPGVEKMSELQRVERKTEKYGDVLQVVRKTFSQTNPKSIQDPIARAKRLKETREYLLSQQLDESAKTLPTGLFRNILDDCGE